MASFWQKRKRVMFWLGGLLILALIPIGCGATSSTGTATSNTSSYGLAHSADTNDQAAKQSAEQAAPASTSSTGKSQQSTIVGKQYLIKTLKLTMQVNDTRKVAVALQQWLTDKDQNITSSGTTYQQWDANNYSISLTFSVPASDYPDVYAYLRDYTSHNGGQLTDFTETVQDVTNDYVDVNSRLSNLRNEQKRLQTLLSQASSVGDLLAIEDKLTSVEGDIESYEAQQNTLTSQVSFYNVTINLDPPASTPTPQPRQASGWSAWQVMQDAFKASLAFGQSILTLLIWLLSFSLYLIPVAAVTWGVQRWRGMRSQNLARPKVALATEVPSSLDASSHPEPSSGSETSKDTEVSE